MFSSSDLAIIAVLLVLLGVVGGILLARFGSMPIPADPTSRATPTLNDKPFLLADLRQFQREVHAVAVAKKFWDEPREDGVYILMMHEELSEASRAIRDGRPMDDKVPEHPAEAVELADCIMRVLDYAEAKELDVVSAMQAKFAFNKTRPNKHGKAY